MEWWNNGKYLLLTIPSFRYSIQSFFFVTANMEITLIIIAILLSVIGIIGCIIPGMPGVPLNYIAMLLLQWAFQPYGLVTLVIFGVLTIIVSVLDYTIPIWTAKRFGATKQGIWGSIIGMILGIFFTPVGMILGTLLGAVIGDLIAGRTTPQATRSGLGSLFGTLVTVGIKLTLAAVIALSAVYEVGVFIF